MKFSGLLCRVCIAGHTFQHHTCNCTAHAVDITTDFAAQALIEAVCVSQLLLPVSPVQVQVHLAARNPEQEKLEAEKRAEEMAKMR